MVASGIYGYLLFGLSSFTECLFDHTRNLNAAGAQEILMSALQPIELCNRPAATTLKEIMFRFKGP